MQTVDLVFIGSGIACTATLTEVFAKLINAPPKKAISITVIEKHHEFWLGIPYGGRSSVNALTITSIADFFTDEEKRSKFFEWFKLNKPELVALYMEKGGLSAKQWLDRNGEAMDREDWKDVYMPRFIFGRYFHGIFQELLKTVRENSLAEVNLINAEGIDTKPVNNNLYQVTYENEDKTTGTVTAKKVVIATGSAPVKEFGKLFTPGTGITYINDLYSPGADINIKKLADTLAAVKEEEERNVLVIGSNASSIEFLYLLAGLPAVTGLINKLVVISRSGLLPYHIIDKKLDDYPCLNLDHIKAEGNYNIKSLVAAAMADLNPAVKNGVIIAYIDRIIGYTIELLQALDEDAKKQFLGIYGMQLSNLFRRSGKDYKGGAAQLLELEKLILHKGGYKHVEPAEAGGILHYTDTDTGGDKVYNTPFKVIINCTGANDLDQSSGRLIYNLVHNKIAAVNLSGKGFYVNEKFEAAPNLYVMGPLLGGNMNKRIHFWHLENASRIMYLAPFLANCLLNV
jgi:uncharacterized NAD(P)/FAD-binding protein YdhS